MSTIIIFFLFFLEALMFNIVGCIIRDCCSDFRRWWKDGIKKVEIKWLIFISISFSVFSFFVFIFVQVGKTDFTSVSKTDSRLYISMNGEHVVGECRLTRWAKRIPSMICGNISGLPSKTFSKEFFIVRFWTSINPFAWGW